MQAMKRKGAKVVVLGDSDVGKTSIIQFILRDAPMTNVQPTIVCCGHDVTIDLDSSRVWLSVWDTAGQEVYRSIVPVYIRGAEIALLVYDVTNPASFFSLEKWYSVLMEEANENVHVFIVGNKIDLGASFNPMTTELARRFEGRCSTVCALDGTGINELFRQVAREAYHGSSEHVHAVAVTETRVRRCC